MLIEKYLTEGKGTVFVLVSASDSSYVRATLNKSMVKTIEKEMKNELGMSGAMDTRVSVKKITLE